MPDKMIVLKPFRYRNRRMLPGDDFVANDRDRRLVTIYKRGKFVREAADLPEPPKALLKSVPDERQELRAEYETMVGKRPYMGWDAETLRQKMDEHLSEVADVVS